MKLSFSTLSCPDWSFSDIYATAADLGYNGIEIRGVADELYAPKIDVFSPEKIDGTRDQLVRRRLEIPILTTGAYIIGNPDAALVKREVEDYSALAQKLGVKYIRLLVEQTPDPRVTNPDIDAAVAEFSSLCDVAAKYGITILTETNGILADTNTCRRFIEAVDRENCGVIWDPNHTVRYFCETPARSVLNVGKYIRHVHLKDSVMGLNGKVQYLLTGYGTMPFPDIVNSLLSVGYGGYLSYEWVKRWSRELAEPGVALYQYINYMKDLI